MYSEYKLNNIEQIIHHWLSFSLLLHWYFHAEECHTADYPSAVLTTAYW